MSKPIVFNTLGYEDAIDQSFMDEWDQTEVETEERELKWAREFIENQGGKQAEKQARRRAKKRARECDIWDE